MGGLQPGFARRIGPRFAYDTRFLRTAVQDLHEMFPSFRDVPIETGWGGPVDVAGLALPSFGSNGRGNVHHGLGYSGNGVGPARLGGQILAALALRADDGFTRLGVVGDRPKRFPPEPVRSPGMAIVNAAIHRRDDRLDAERRPGIVADLFARMPRRMGYNLGPR